MLTDVLLCLVGFVAGAMNAIAGGGMLVGFPALLAAGVPALSANATSNLVILPGQLASAYGYRKHLRKVPGHYLLLLIPCVVGACIGALILRRTPSGQFEHIIPELILVAVLLFAFQPLLHFHLHKHLRSQAKRVGPLLWISLATLPVAVYGGYFGAGFGFIMLAFLGFTKLHHMHQMQALKNISSAAIALVSLLVLLNGSFIDWHHGIVMAVGSTIGGYVGARLAQRVSSHAIRMIVILIGIITALYIALR